MDPRPIGVFDSGIGGLTAVRELRRILPAESVIYFGDTGRVPYGPRSRETIVKYAMQDIRFMRTFDCKLLVIACGTVSSAALDILAGSCDIPMVGVVRPAVREALRQTKNRKIGVIGTSGTIRSGAYTRLLAEYDPGAQVFARACPLLVPLVENGRFAPDDRAAAIIVDEYLAPLREEGVDTLILGCTHFPLLAPLIARCMGPEVALVDSGAAVATDAHRLLEMTEKQAPGPACRRYFVSDSPEDFALYAEQYLGETVEGAVRRVDIENY